MGADMRFRRTRAASEAQATAVKIERGRHLFAPNGSPTTTDKGMYNVQPPRPMHPTHQEPVFQLRLTEHTGVLLLWTNSTRTYRGTYAQLVQAYERAQRHNYVAGWWSIGSLLVWNMVTILSNQSALKRLRTQVEMARSRGMHITEPNHPNP